MEASFTRSSLVNELQLTTRGTPAGTQKQQPKLSNLTLITFSFMLRFYFPHPPICTGSVRLWTASGALVKAVTILES